MLHDETPAVAGRVDHPPLTDLIGLDPNFTGGLSPEEHLRRQRCGECDEALSALTAARADLETARAVALSNKRAHRTAFEECERLEQKLAEAREQAKQAQAELARLLATPGVAALTAPLCPCRPNAASLHMKDCPVWVNIGPNLAQRQYVRRDSLATTTAALYDDAEPVAAGGGDTPTTSGHTDTDAGADYAGADLPKELPLADARRITDVIWGGEPRS